MLGTGASILIAGMMTGHDHTAGHSHNTSSVCLIARLTSQAALGSKDSIQDSEMYRAASRRAIQQGFASRTNPPLPLQVICFFVYFISFWWLALCPWD